MFIVSLSVIMFLYIYICIYLLLLNQEADDPHVCRVILQKFDALIDAGIQPHRVAIKFCSPFPGGLRADMEKFRDGGIMGARLRTEITAYQCCMLDDSFTEGPHAVTSQIALSACHSTPSWWSATARLRQNISVKHVMDQIRPGRFAALWPYWRMVLTQDRPGRLRRLRDRKYVTDFCKKVYHMDEYAITPLESVKQTQAMFLSFIGQGTGPCVKFSSTVRMLKQYMLAALTNSGVYSVPTGASGSDQSHTVFQVVDLGATRFKLVDAPSHTAVKNTRIPVLLQPLEIWNFSGSMAGAHSVFVCGPPEFRDVMDLAGKGTPYKCLVDDMQQWVVSKNSDVSGCLHIHSPCFVKNKEWYS